MFVEALIASIKNGRLGIQLWMETMNSKRTQKGSTNFLKVDFPYFIGIFCNPFQLRGLLVTGIYLHLHAGGKIHDENSTNLLETSC